MRGIIKHEDYEVEYFEYGNGRSIILAFHGFNNHAEDFKVLGDSVGKDYRIIAFNIFFHGDSHAHKNLVEKGFSTNDLRNLFDEIISLFPSEKYSLMGYSLGGRIVLKLLEIYPEKIENIFLLAPDGIRISLTYRILTQTLLGRTLLRRVIDRPSVFFVLAKVLRKSGLVDEKKYQFGIGNYDTKQKREKVYLVWMTLRKIISAKQEIKSIIKKNNISMYLFFGEHDRIIPKSIGKNFQKGMEENITLYILDSGHRLLKEKTLKEIAEKLKQIKNDPRKT